MGVGNISPENSSAARRHAAVLLREAYEIPIVTTGRMAVKCCVFNRNVALGAKATSSSLADLSTHTNFNSSQKQLMVPSESRG